MLERTTIGITIASLLVATGCASAPQTPEVPAPEVPGIAVEPAQDFARPDRARAKMRSEGRKDIPGDDADDEKGDGDGSDWTFRAEAYLWIPSIDGDVGKGYEADVDIGIGDMWDIVSDSLDSGLAGRFGGSNGDWGFMAEYIRIRTEDEVGDSTVGSGSAKVDVEPELELDVLELAVTKSLGSAHTFSKFSRPVSYEAFGGVRLVDADTQLAFKNGSKLDADDNDWADPIIGARASAPIHDRASIDVRGDIGGFGIGEASDLTWRADIVLRIRIYEGLGAFAGWQALDIDQERGSGAGEYTYDLRFSGPYMGLQLDF
jgi:hypothetical protein